MEANKEKLVFLVEDDKFYLQLLENYFAQKTGFKTRSFTNGHDCVDNLNLKPDLIVLDYLLDKHDNRALDGKAVYNEIKVKSPSAKVVVVSAQQSADVVFGLVKDGVRNYVMKDEETFAELDQLLEEYAWI